jgi:hypothetical protein
LVLPRKVAVRRGSIGAWREVLLVALEVDDPPENIVSLDAYRAALAD